MMTAFLPLDAAAPLPPSPAFLVPTPDPVSHVKRVIKTILKARRIAVVCGAGISVRAGIPDFRSSEGLFQSLKKDHPTLSSGKDLFDASVFNSEDTTSLFCQMIAQLSQLSEAAEPTPFHRFLRVLDERRRLLRVYTQNIDALEEKSGLTFGVPELDGKRYKPRASKGKTTATETAVPEEPASSRLPSPPAETPKCIPLHGTLQLMHCQTCRHSYPLRDHLDSLAVGTPPICPQCTALEETRQLVGKRARGVGRLRPSVVLYNEDHKDGEEVGNVVRKDLIGSSKGKGRAGADLLLVVGTSLRVPGTKRIVREFSKAVRSRYAALNAPVEDASATSHGLATPTPSPRRSPAADEEPPVRTIYLNLDFPVPTREWEGVFDVWLRGDAQEFAQMVHDELGREEEAKEATRERRRRREEAAEMARQAEERGEAASVQLSAEGSPVKKGKKRKEQAHSENDRHAHPTKKRKTGAPPLSPVSPAKKPRKQKAKASKEERLDRGGLPTPPVSRDDSRRLTIRLPPRSQVFAGVVIEKPAPRQTIPPALAGPASSPLSSPPVSVAVRSPNLPSRTASTSTQESSPLSTPPHSAYASCPYDMSRMSCTLSEISSPLSSPPPSTHLPSPPRLSRTISETTQLSSPLSSVPPSPYLQAQPTYVDGHSRSHRDLSPPLTPSPPRRKRAASGTGSMIGDWLGKKPGMRQPSYYSRPALPDTGEDPDLDVLGLSDDTDPPRSESRLPESYVRTVPASSRPRRRGRS
ncbi:DHS-like NAD/FAD-binding domain-containing protein [Trametes elegans]|nr:DHS-like NAD/FAD-binding domain-containing protein [Trametes elegans]